MQTNLCDYDIADIIIEQCERLFRVKDLMEKSRRRTISRPRQIAWKVMRDVTDLSYPEIGDMFKMDHTTVMSGVRIVEADKKLSSRASSIRRKVSLETAGQSI